MLICGRCCRQHLPSTPAPWYADHPVGDLAVVMEPNYNYLGSDKHAFFPHEPPIDSAAAAAIARENSKRLRTMLSVDDLIRDVREYLIQQDEWDNTVMLYTSGAGTDYRPCSLRPQSL